MFYGEVGRRLQLKFMHTVTMNADGFSQCRLQTITCDWDCVQGQGSNRFKLLLMIVCGQYVEVKS